MMSFIIEDIVKIMQINKGADNGDQDYNSKMSLFANKKYTIIIIYFPS